MGSPREAARSGWAWRESDDAHAHYAIAKHLLFRAYRPTPSQPRVAWLCMWLVIDKNNTDTQIDSGTDTEHVETFMPNFVSLLCRLVDRCFWDRV
jgi:hypothetical protein